MAFSQLIPTQVVYTDLFKIDHPGGVIEPGEAQDYNAEDAGQNYILGMRGYIVADERVYRYGEASAVAIAAGVLVSPDLSQVAVVDTDNAVNAAEAIGSVNVTMDNAAYASITADIFAGGIFGITDDLGEGHGYPLSGNTASVNTDEVDLLLNRAVRVALDTTSDTMIMPNLFAQLVIADATDPIVVGVTPLAITADNFFWVQRGGRAVILLETTAPIGNNMTLGDGTPGACQLKDAETEPNIGFCIIAGDDGGHAGVYLTLE